MKKAIAKSLSILGFTIPIFGCDVPDMYGTPSATYEVKGKVLDADGDPIKGIKITMKDDATAPNPYNIVESQSLENGDYTISGRVMPTDKLYLSVEDIDGIGNGGDFESRMIELDFSKVEYTGDKEAWHVGTKSLEQDIILVEKSNSTNE